MNKSVKVIEFQEPIKKLKKVCAYARVSSDKAAMLQSLSSQVSHYNEMNNRNTEWEFAGIYADEGISGTKEDRPKFLQMIKDAKDGKIDMIITKSISRFGRNTETVIKTIRELSSIGVDIFFEAQNMHTLSSDGEFMLTILASYYQEEARSVSENMKWRIKKNFEEGKPWGAKLYGYDVVNSKFYINEREAKIVKFIYELYLKGYGKYKIASELNKLGYKTRAKVNWTATSVMWILTNYNYTGNLLLQKTYSSDYLSKKKKINKGELPKYHVEKSHEAIIDLKTWNKIQEEMARRNKKIKRKLEPYQSPLRGKIKCGLCGKSFLRKDHAYRTFWICSTYSRYSKAACPSKRLDEEELLSIVSELDIENIEKILVYPNYPLTIILKNKSEISKTWKTHSRKDSWTKEMKERARLKELERTKKNV